MRITVLGGGPGGPGGPGGLLAALLAKRGDPAREVTVFERNRAGDTFGFGGLIVAELPVTKMGLCGPLPPPGRADMTGPGGRNGRRLCGI